MTSTSDAAAEPLFAGLPPDTVAAIRSELTELRLEPGDVLWQQGDPPTEDLHIIASGSVEVTVRTPVEQDVVLATLGASEILGELPLLAGGDRAATVRATEPTTVLVLEAGRFRALLLSFDPAATAFRRHLLEIVCARLRGAHSELANQLGGRGAPTAVAATPSLAELPPPEYVQRLRLFRDFPADELQALLRRADVVALRRGDVVLAEGGKATACIVTLNGVLEELVRRGGAAVRVRLVGPGLATGYVGLIDGRPSSVQVSARERSRLAIVPAAAFDELFAARTREGRVFVEAIQRDLVTTLRLAQRPQARLSFR